LWGEHPRSRIPVQSHWGAGVVSFWKRTQPKEISEQSLEQYANQSFDNIGLVGRVHFDVTPCDV